MGRWLIVTALMALMLVAGQASAAPAGPETGD